MKTLPTQTGYRIEDRFGEVVIEASGTLAVHEPEQAWLLFHSAVRAWKAEGKFEPHTGRRLVLVAVVTSAFDAFRQRVEAHRAAGHPGGVGGCKACPTPATARRQIGARS